MGETKQKQKFNWRGMWFCLFIFNVFGFIVEITKISIGGIFIFFLFAVITLVIYQSIPAPVKPLTPLLTTGSTMVLEKKKEVEPMAFPLSDTIVYDLETTGLEPWENDEILQLAIINGCGKTLFNSYFRPDNKKRWPKAQETNHITWQMVKDKPRIKDKAVLGEIIEIFKNAKLIVGYNNKGFDNDFLFAISNDLNNILREKPQYDVMLEYAKFRGEWDDYHGDWRWFRLAQASKHFQYKPTGEFHDAEEDCRATLWILKHLEKVEYNKTEKESKI